jgi:hypothetical protein
VRCLAIAAPRVFHPVDRQKSAAICFFVGRGSIGWEALMKVPSSRIAAPLALLATLVLPVAAQATPLSPGPGAFPPDIFSFTCPGAGCPTLLASTTTNFTSTDATLLGTVEAAVYSDPITGGLDFVYQVTNSAGSTDSIGRVTAINFTGFLTDVGYTPTGSVLGDGFVNGTIAPELVDRVSADVVGFSFNAPLTTLIAPDQTSTVLVIETNATHFTAGHVNVIDGGVTTVDAFEPLAAASTPEPAVWSLMIAGFAGLGFATRRRRVSA